LRTSSLENFKINGNIKESIYGTSEFRDGKIKGTRKSQRESRRQRDITRDITKCRRFKNKGREVLKSKSGFSEKSGRKSSAAWRKEKARNVDGGNVSVPVNHSEGVDRRPWVSSVAQKP